MWYPEGMSLLGLESLWRHLWVIGIRFTHYHFLSHCCLCFYDYCFKKLWSGIETSLVRLQLIRKTCNWNIIKKYCKNDINWNHITHNIFFFSPLLPYSLHSLAEAGSRTGQIHHTSHLCYWNAEHDCKALENSGPSNIASKQFFLQWWSIHIYFEGAFWKYKM